jgi:hypothetical protein
MLLEGMMDSIIIKVVKIFNKNVKGVLHNMAYNIPHGFFALH